MPRNLIATDCSDLWIALTSILQKVIVARKLVLTVGESRFPHSNGTREPPALGQPRRESVLARLAFLINQTARSQVEVDQSYESMIVPRTFLRGQAASAAQPRRARSRSACGPEASSAFAPLAKDVQALANPTMRPGLPVLCRAVSQIVGVMTSVSVGETVVDLTNSICMLAGMCTRSVGGAVPVDNILQCMEKIGFLVNAT